MNNRPELSTVAETLLIPTYYRALESQRPDAIIRDEQAVALIDKLDYDFSQVERIRVAKGNLVARFMGTREIDRMTRDFIDAHADAVVVHIGCGLDSRYQRVDNGQVQWYDLDLPEVIELRKELLGTEGGRYHHLACSVFDDSWLDGFRDSQRPMLFVAEAVLVYFSEEQVRSLLLKLRNHFPGAELVFDGWSPFFIRLGNFQLGRSRFSGLLQWGFWRSKTIESWGPGIRLLEEWGFFDQPEPRMAPYRWIAPLFRLFKPMRIFHYQLSRPEQAA